MSFAQVVLTAVLAVAPADPLASARALYDDGDYAGAARTVAGLLKSSSLDPHAASEARCLLGASRFYAGDRAGARTAFVELFQAEPAYELDARRFAPEVLTLASEARRETLARPVDVPVAATSPAASLEKPSASVAICLLPFGAGQFAQGRTTRGALFASTEGIAFTTAAVSLGLLESSKVSGSFLRGGTFRDPAQAEKYQAVYLVSFWTGVIIAGTGVVDALLSRGESKP